MGLCFSTFAISLQLFPASLICFNLCSSAGVHGVFVRLFFRGSCVGGSASAPGAAVDALLASAPAAVALVAMVSWGWARLTDLRFREFPGVGGCGTLAKDS